MNHSLKSYLERQSTEDLQAALDLCLRQLTDDTVPDEMILILNILEKREESLTIEDTPELIECWQKFLECYHSKHPADDRK